jgi:hypothetical protein
VYKVTANVPVPANAQELINSINTTFQQGNRVMNESAGVTNRNSINKVKYKQEAFMNVKIISATAVLLLFSATASADCVDDIAELENKIESPLIEASNEAREAAKVEKEAAVTHCAEGDEAGAAERIANALALLGQ